MVTFTKQIVFAFLVVLVFNVQPSLASVVTNSTSVSTPTLSLIMPRGVKRGAEHTLRFSGARLADAQEIFLYDPKGVVVKEIKPVNANNIDVVITVSEDCRLGEHIAQVRAASGISEFRSFYVGAFDVVADAEPNNELATATPIEQNVTVTGTITNEDVDLFGFDASKGQRLSVEIEAIRLGAMFDPFIAVLDSNRFEMAVSDDTSAYKQDGFITLTIPEDGKYYLLVRETSYGGNGNCRYRVHLGDFPRPTVVYPAGGKPGEKRKLQFFGDALGTLEKEMEIPTEFGFHGGMSFVDEKGVTPSPIPFRLSDLENKLESEPNNTWDEAKEVTTLPAAFNGVIGTPGDFDYYRFSAKKGQVFLFDCYARRINSGLDPVMNIFKANKQHIVGDDDARRPDCYLRFPVPEDGEYFLRIYDHLRRGQPDFVYRVEAALEKPTVSFTIPRVDRYSQTRQQISVAKGNRFATLVNATRGAFGGELKLIEEGLPAGIKMIAPPMRGNLNVMPVVFEAAEDAELNGQLVDFRGSHVDDAKNITGGFSNLADFANGAPNNALYYGCTVNKLAMAVTEELPFKLEVVQPKIPLVRDGAMSLKIVAHRKEGFDEPINLQFPFRPPGLGTTYQVVIPKGASEIVYPLNANANAQIGKWPVYSIGWANVNGPAWASTQMAEIEIADPWVKMEMKRVVVERGKLAKMVAKLTHNVSFEGTAKAELLGIPPHTTVSPLEFTKETKELIFDVQTTAKSPKGKHKGVFCRVTIPVGDENIVATAARSELQITKPKPAPKEAIAKAAPEKTKPKPAETKAVAKKPAGTKAVAKKPVPNPAEKKPAETKAVAKPAETKAVAKPDPKK